MDETMELLKSGRHRTLLLSGAVISGLVSMTSAAAETFEPYLVPPPEGRLVEPPEYNYRWGLPEPVETITVSSNLTAETASGKSLAAGESLSKLVNELGTVYRGKSIKIIIDAGSYELDSPIRPESGHWISGQIETILTASGPMNAMIHVKGKDRVTVSDLTLIGKGIGEGSTSGILVNDGSTRVLVARVQVAKTGGIGILFSGADTRTNVVRNCLVRETGKSGIGFMGAGYASVRDNQIIRTTNHGIIFAAGGACSEVIGNTVQDAGIYNGEFSHGIAFDSHGHLHQGHSNLIKNNRIINARCAGIEIADGQDQMSIIGNTIDNSGREASMRPDQYGIYFGGSLSQSYECLIQGNTVKKTYNIGIRIDAPHPEQAVPILDADGELTNPFGPTSHVEIIDNTVKDSNHYGIELGYVRNIFVSGNTIGGSGKADIHIAGKAGTLHQYPARDVVLQSNILQSARKTITNLVKNLTEVQ